MIQEFDKYAGEFLGWYRDDVGDLLYYPKATSRSHEYILYLDVDGESVQMIVYENMATNTHQEIVPVPPGMNEEELCAWAIATWRML